MTCLVTCYEVLSRDDLQPNEPPLSEWLTALGLLRIARPFARPPRAFIEAATLPSSAESLGATPREILGLCRAAGAPTELLVPFAQNVVPTGTSFTHLLVNTAAAPTQH